MLGEFRRYPTECLFVNPYTPPQTPRLRKSRSAAYVAAMLVGSLIATVPVGMAINIVLYDIDFMPSNRTAVYWATSSVVASIVCSSVAAMLTIRELNWLHFWFVYQAGWLAYCSTGLGVTSSRLDSAIYFWTPFVVPAIVASITLLFCLTRNLSIMRGTEHSPP